MAAIGCEGIQNQKLDTFSESDVLQIIKDLGGRATSQQIKEKALERYTERAIKYYLDLRLEKLRRWCEIDVKHVKRTGFIYFLTLHENLQSTKNQFEVIKVCHDEQVIKSLKELIVKS